MYFSPILLVALLSASIPAHADRVIGIADGDTLTVLHDQRPLKIRLSDIDAPEKRQAFGQASKQSLSDMCFGKEVAYRTQAIDKYGRTVARVSCAGIDVNRAQIERGMAWVYVQYNTDGSLPAVQLAARSGGKGLWADKAPMPPWEFRHPAVTGIPNATGCMTGSKGGRYVLVDGRKQYGG